MSARSEFNDSKTSLQISTYTPPSPPPSLPPSVSRSPPLDMEYDIHLACFGLFMVIEAAFSAMHKVDASHSTKMLRYDMFLSSTILIVYCIVLCLE
ncbi:hypothetical protein Tco_1041686 [Tanacetum coccineum]|uniref:Uncharacterized protein n=1 Tax=Tanacetum coccineum TaxID=301880 RepID=A0ABQ5GHE9_9ASTR